MHNKKNGRNNRHRMPGQWTEKSKDGRKNAPEVHNNGGRKDATEVHNIKKTSSPEGKDVFLSYKRLAISGFTRRR